MASTDVVTLPPDVQAALDAYLAARVDDATWTAYVDSLGPGVALDVATALCQWTERDDRAVDWIRQDFEPDPDEPDEPDESPAGLPAASRSLDRFLDAGPGLYGIRVVLDSEHDRAEPWRAVTWIVRLEHDEWESEGRVTGDEWQIWMAALDDAPWVDYWAVAACRAACHAWAPEWAREQHADKVGIT